MIVNYTETWQHRLFLWTCKKMVKWGWISLRMDIQLPTTPKITVGDLRDERYLAEQIIQAKEDLAAQYGELTHWLTDYENVLRDRVGEDDPAYAMAFNEADGALRMSHEAIREWKHTKRVFKERYPGIKKST